MGFSIAKINSIQYNELSAKPNKIGFYAGNSNSLERSPQTDSYEKKKRRRKQIGLIAGALAIKGVILGSICYYLGRPKNGAQKKLVEQIKDGWNNLRNKCKS